MSRWLVAPILIPMLTGVLCLLAVRRPRLNRWISVTGAALELAAAVALLAAVRSQGTLVLQVGGWPAPFGITLVADLLSAFLLAAACLLAFTLSIYSLASIGSQLESFAYHTLYHFLIMGVSGAFLTGDLFNLYVWFEVMLMASFVLMALGGERGQMEGAIKYVTLNLLASAFFLAALGILYGLVGTLNLADLAVKIGGVTERQPQGMLMAVALLLLVAFGIKSAVFPLFFWLPASYHTPPAAVSALFSGLLTKVGVYSLIRVFTILFVQNPDLTHNLILWISIPTMVTGVLGAVAQNQFRRVLSFHIISQIGYMILGLGLFTPLGLAGAIYFTAHNMIAKTNLFLVSGVVERLQGSQWLSRLGGLYVTQPLLAGLFLVPALSLAGLPPLSGFFAKLSLIQASFDARQYLAGGVAVAVSLFTLLSMMKLWNEAFWKPRAEDAPADAELPDRARWLVPIALLSLVTLAMGLGANWFYSLALDAGHQLMNPNNYILAVMGGQP